MVKVGLDFSGRWYTRDGVLVAVHRNEDTVRNGVGEWWGHKLGVIPFSNRRITWDERGNCVNDRRLDLMTAIYAEKHSYAYNIEGVGCEDCKRWQREH